MASYLSAQASGAPVRVGSRVLDYETAMEVSEDPWGAPLRDLAPAARVLYYSSRHVIARKGQHPRFPPAFERDLATMLLSVLQARTLRRATWALFGATAILAVVTLALVIATLQLD